MRGHQWAQNIEKEWNSNEQQEEIMDYQNKYILRKLWQNCFQSDQSMNIMKSQDLPFVGIPQKNNIKNGLRGIQNVKLE
ncbi:hypothetical protein pb186bvf_016224 [Paramecium bursaria]